MTDYHFCFPNEATAHTQLALVLDGYDQSVTGVECVIDGPGWSAHLLPVLRKRGAWDDAAGAYAFTTLTGYHVNLRVALATAALDALDAVHGVHPVTPLRVWA